MTCKPKKKRGEIAEEVFEALVPDLIKIDTKLDMLKLDIKRLEKMLKKMEKCLSIDEEYTRLYKEARDNLLAAKTEAEIEKMRKDWSDPFVSGA